VLERRLARARELLTRTAYPKSFALGFVDQSHFTRRFRQWTEYLQGNSESCNILAHLVGRHSTIRRIASRHYSAEGLLRMCRRLQRANLMRLQAAFASK
jgi:AraC-like DNA-binding protein